MSISTDRDEFVEEFHSWTIPRAANSKKGLFHAYSLAPCLVLREGRVKQRSWRDYEAEDYRQDLWGRLEI